MLRSVVLIGIFSLLLEGLAFSNTYGLKVGEKAPAIVTQDVEQKGVDTVALAKKGPVVLVFYRGGWCPICNRQLQKLEKDVAPKLGKYDATMIAISVDRRGEGQKTNLKFNQRFRVVSDPDLKILTPYNVVYDVPPSMVKKYVDYGIDLEKASGKKHHKIAVPAVFVIDGKGVIRYAFADENYKVRAQNKDILQALQSLQAPKL